MHELCWDAAPGLCPSEAGLEGPACCGMSLALSLFSSSSDPFPVATGTGCRVPPAPGLCHLWGSLNARAPALSGHPCARGGPCRTHWGLWGHGQAHPWCPSEEGIKRKDVFLLLQGCVGLLAFPAGLSVGAQGSLWELWGAQGAAGTQQQLSQSEWPDSSWNTALQPICPYKRVAKHSCGMRVLLLPMASQSAPAWLGSHLGYQF